MISLITFDYQKSVLPVPVYRKHQGPSLLTEVNQPGIDIKAWIGDHIHVKQNEVITHPSPIFSSGLVKSAVKFGHG